MAGQYASRMAEYRPRLIALRTNSYASKSFGARSCILFEVIRARTPPNWLPIVAVIFAVISSCTEKMSARGRSYRSAQTWMPEAPSISCAVILTVSPDRCTLPSKTKAAPKASATVCTSTESPRYWNVVLRAKTRISGKRDSSVIKSSVRPSEKYCCSGSPLRLVNGSTAIDGLSNAATAASSGKFCHHLPAQRADKCRDDQGSQTGAPGRPAGGIARDVRG